MLGARQTLPARPANSVVHFHLVSGNHPSFRATPYVRSQELVTPSHFHCQPEIRMRGARGSADRVRLVRPSGCRRRSLATNGGRLVISRAESHFLARRGTVLSSTVKPIAQGNGPPSFSIHQFHCLSAMVLPREHSQHIAVEALAGTHLFPGRRRAQSQRRCHHSPDEAAHGGVNEVRGHPEDS